MDIITIEQLQTIKKLAVKYSVCLEGNENCIPPSIKKMTSEHGLNLEDFHLKRIQLIVMMKRNLETKPEHSDGDLLELAEFTKLLRLCISNSKGVAISATIKAEKHSVKLNFGKNISNLSVFTNALLYLSNDGFYEYFFGWSAKRKMGETTDRILEEYMMLPEIYSDEELEAILNYERGQLVKSQAIKKKRNPISLPLKKLVAFYKEVGCFDKVSKTILTNEACFLYDTLAFLEIIVGNSWYNNQDKYQEIKRLMN